ncbi:MAG TPA: Ig domain-containing protein [Candidatus Acidoferrales bacterium]|jgi:hypothetical protein|nr:Ig domain-containing protein [Candidatus Acidoferrales bacterium]
MKYVLLLAASLVHLHAGIVIGPSSLPGGVQYQPYAIQLAANGGTAPYTWKITWPFGPPVSDPLVPAPGLTLDSKTGMIGGTLNGQGTYHFKVQVIDATAAMAQANLSIGVQSVGTIGSCSFFPQDNVWRQPIDKLPVHPMSASWVGIYGGARLHHDFGADYGIPFMAVSGTQAKVPAAFEIKGESDPGPYPIPETPPAEGGIYENPLNYNGDHHVLIVDRDQCKLYEVYNAYPVPGAGWRGYSGAIFDLNSNALRPMEWTSSDAAGLPIVPALMTYDEVASGEVKHALRWTFNHTGRTILWPARHQASGASATPYPGSRWRLKTTVDISTFSPRMHVILTAMKKYGLFVADNGGSGFFQAVPDPRWDENELNTLAKLHVSDFEAVDESALMVDPNSGATKPILLPPPTLPRAVKSAPYSVAIDHTGGMANRYRYSITSGSLPPGLSADSALGVIAGTPIESGTYAFTVTLTDGALSNSKQVTLPVDDLAVVLGTPVTDPLTGVVCSRGFSAANGTAPYTFIVVGGALPDGLTLSSSGLLSGAATRPGTYSFTVKATDAIGRTGYFDSTVIVEQGPRLPRRAGPTLCEPYLNTMEKPDPGRCGLYSSRTIAVPRTNADFDVGSVGVAHQGLRCPRTEWGTASYRRG